VRLDNAPQCATHCLIRAMVGHGDSSNSCFIARLKAYSLNRGATANDSITLVNTSFSGFIPLAH